MSVYTKENPEKLNQSLESILNQTYPADEIVLVKDGVLDEKLNEIIDEYQGKHPTIFSVYPLSKNKGLGYALNYGLEKCKNSLVARMDTDDKAYAERFEVQVNEFKLDPDLSILGAYVNSINRGKIEVKKVPLTDKQIKNLIWTCPIIHPTVMYKKEDILKIGNYNKNLRRRQDYDLWYRSAYANLKFKNLGKPLLEYSNDEIQYNQKNNKKVQWIQLKIGLKGNKLNKLGIKSYMGVIGNYLYKILPLSRQRILKKYVKEFDPRFK